MSTPYFPQAAVAAATRNKARKAKQLDGRREKLISAAASLRGELSKISIDRRDAVRNTFGDVGVLVHEYPVPPPKLPEQFGDVVGFLKTAVQEATESRQLIVKLSKFLPVSERDIRAHPNGRTAAARAFHEAAELVAKLERHRHWPAIEAELRAMAVNPDEAILEDLRNSITDAQSEIKDLNATIEQQAKALATRDAQLKELDERHRELRTNAERSVSTLVEIASFFLEKATPGLLGEVEVSVTRNLIVHVDSLGLAPSNIDRLRDALLAYTGEAAPEPAWVGPSPLLPGGRASSPSDLGRQAQYPDSIGGEARRARTDDA